MKPRLLLSSPKAALQAVGNAAAEDWGTLVQSSRGYRNRGYHKKMEMVQTRPLLCVSRIITFHECKEPSECHPQFFLSYRAVIIYCEERPNLCACVLFIEDVGMHYSMLMEEIIPTPWACNIIAKLITLPSHFPLLKISSIFNK